jgi:hypothetical protein
MKIYLSWLQRTKIWQSQSGQFSLACLSLAFLVSAGAYLMEGYWMGLSLVIFLAALWLLGALRGWDWLADLGFVALSISTALGFGMKIYPLLMLVGFCLSLAAWDLMRFSRRLIVDEQSPGLEMTHLRRLVLVLLVGGGLAGAALLANANLQLRFTLSQTILLVLGLGLAFSLAFSRLRKS